MKYNRLVGSAPAPREQSRLNQFTVGAIVAYSFDWNGAIDWPKF